jgi:hypothetical protein
MLTVRFSLILSGIFSVLYPLYLKFNYRLKLDFMKKVLSVLAIAGSLTMAACGSNPNAALQNEKGAAYTDTVGLAQFREWKAQQAMAEMSAAAAASASTAYAAPVKKSSSATRSSSTRRTSGSTASQSKSIGSTTSYPAKPAAKKGWSKAAKGAAIGAGGGAIIGAVVNKRNRAVGAVIGGVAGGAVGYGIGRSIDKKDGRY